jgi:dolichol-phosphate mannosyltransferase
MLSVVVPVFNEQETLLELHRRLTQALAREDAWELVLVDDGSTDGSWGIMTDLVAADARVRLVRLSRNFGHQAALTAGLDAARGAAVVILDADLQDPPELIPALVARWREGYDVVYAVREERQGESRFRLLTAHLYYKVLRRVAGIDIPENVGDFRLLSRRVCEALAAMPERARYLRGMTTWVGFRQVGVPYRREPRFAGTSKYPFRRSLRLALDGLTSFSTVPVRLVTWIGFVIVALCPPLLAWTLYTRFATDHAAPGWTSLLVVVLLLGGVQLMSLGMIGQYVARIFDEAKGRPLYFVAELVEGVAGLELPLPLEPTVVPDAPPVAPGRAPDLPPEAPLQV